MKSTKLLIATALMFGATFAHADIIDPDCDASKMAKSAALDATVGVSGRCTPSKAAERAADDVKDNAKDAVENTTDKVDDKVNSATDNVSDAKDSVNNAKDNVNDLKDAPVKTLIK